MELQWSRDDLVTTWTLTVHNIKYSAHNRSLLTKQPCLSQKQIVDEPAKQHGWVCVDACTRCACCVSEQLEARWT